MGAALLAISWEPEIRGIVVVLIGFTVLCGSVYLLLATNIGARLGLMVAIAALFGWMLLMGLVWWTYGIGLKGQEPKWLGVEVIYGDLTQAGSEVAQTDGIDQVSEDNRVDGWIRLPEDDAEFGQAVAAADEYIAEFEVFAPGTYVAEAVFDKGGERGPLLFGNESLDFLAFRHSDHYAMVQVRPALPQIEEPGRAVPPPVVDESQPPTYVLMKRDAGSLRRPAQLITIGSALVFAWACWRLNKRDEVLEDHLEEAGEAEAPVPATTGS